MTLLLPVAQCCTIRFTTLRTLLKFQASPGGLGAALEKSLATDDIAPVLLDKHYQAINRRVKIILKTINVCLGKKEASDVIVDDGF